MKEMSRQHLFLRLGTVDILDPIFSMRACPVHRSVLGSISGLSPLDARNATPVMGIKDVSRHCQMFSVGQNPPLA